ncbi:hypothetical protein FACS1894189_4060 [Planctomycetales bacterium]|nr:hypothetical protein FACS1894189_4060 [Planctomycetales bacterium]
MPPTVPAVSPTLAPPAVQQAPLDPIVIFPPEGGRVLHLPEGWSLEVFDDFRNYLLRDQQTPIPLFVLQEIAAAGKIVENRVETTVKFVIITSSYRAVRVPLGLKFGILPFTDKPDDPDKKSLFQYIGTGSAYLNIDPKTGDYTAIVQPKRQESQPAEHAAVPVDSQGEKKPAVPVPLEQRHELTVSLWFPLVKTGTGENAESKLAVSFPQSVGSQFTLDIPMLGAETTVTSGSLLNAVEVPDKQTTRLKILGLRSDFEVSWRKKKAEITDDRPVLFVDKAVIDVRLDPRSTVYDATLPISSLTSSFEKLQIRLPQGAALDRETTEKYAASAGYTIGETNDVSILEVRFPRKTTGPISVRLKTVRQYEQEKPDFKRDLTGFEVIGAERQTGYLTVTIPSDMKANWEPNRGIRRAENSIPGSGSPVAAGDARFEFVSQPFLLQARIVLPQTRINVKPEYQINVTKGSLSMTARFSYIVSGSKTEQLKIQLPDAKWNCEAGPPNLVDSSGIEQDESGLLTIPLRSPTEGAFDIELRAYRSIPFDDQGKQRIVLALPQPQVTWSEPAPVVIVPANNVEIQPIDVDTDSETAQRTIGLIRQNRRSMPIRLELADLQQEPLFYRTEPTGAVFVADIIFHQQKITATVQTDIRLRDEREQVTQVLSCDVAYVPIDKMYFLIPKPIEENGNLQIRLGNRTLEFRDVVSLGSEDVPENWSRKILQLPEAMFKFQLVFRYSIPPVPLAPDLTALFSTSFIKPEDTPVTGHRVNLIVPTGYHIELQNDLQSNVKQSWEAVSESGSGGNTPFVFRSSGSPSRIALSISVSDRNVSGTTVVDRAWLQTWLTGTIRQDRGTYLITSDRDSVTLKLPADALKDRKIFVQLDHAAIPADVSANGKLTIPLKPEHHDRPIEIEVNYQYSFETPKRSVQLDLPDFDNDVLVRHEYWQIILPPNRHIIGIPNGWTPEYRWAWNGLFFGRIPSVHQEDIGLKSLDNEAAAPVSNTNQYLFSNLHPAPEVSLYIVDRSLIVLFSSGLALFVGLILIYIPESRYYGSLFGLAVAFFAVLFYRPAPVLLMLQASAFGVCLALGVWYLYRIFHREHQWVVPPSPSWSEASQPQEVIMEESEEIEN